MIYLYILMDEIFKINYMLNDKINKIVVFIGNKNINYNKELNDVINNNKKKSIIYKIFNNDELKYIKDNNVTVEFADILIYSDDNVDTIKKKILLKSDRSFFYSEMYLFGKTNKYLDTNIVYNELSNYGKEEIIKKDLLIYLLNFSNNLYENLLKLDKDIIDYDDILNLNIEKMNYYVNISLDIKSNNIYTINPFNYKINNNVEKVYTKNKQVLFMNDLIDNNLYLCLASDIANIEDNKIIKKKLFDIYYPLLEINNINDVISLNDEKEKLILEDSRLFTNNFIKNIQILNNLSELSNDYENNIEYKKFGISEITFVLENNINLYIPLETLFKMIHADENIPFIKYIPGSNRDNIYRLYTDKISETGKKIPFLSKKIINRLNLKLNDKKTVILWLNEKNNYELIVKLNEKGFIEITFKSIEPKEIKNIDEIINNKLNNLLRELQNYYVKSGYNYKIFESIESDNINIVNINYSLTIELENELILDKINKCLSSIVYVFGNNTKTGIDLVYKRISNFNDDESINEKIKELIKKEISEEIIVHEISKSFLINENIVKEKLLEIQNEIQQLDVAFKRKRIRINKSSGINIKLLDVPFTKNISVSIKDVNDLRYIDYITNYLDLIINLSENVYNKKEKNIIDNCDIEKKMKMEIEPISLLESNNEDEIEFLDSENEDEDEDEDVIEFLDSEDEDEDDDEDDDDDEDKKMKLLKNITDNYDEDSEDEDEDEDDKSVGNVVIKKELTKKKINIVGKKLKNPNIITEKLYERDPVLFLKKDDGKKFKNYIRTCPSNFKRQPVVLNKEELLLSYPDYFDKNLSDSKKVEYKNDILPYSSKESKQQNYYICPRYWCLTENRILTEEQINNGECGGKDAIIENDALEVKEGKQIYEFRGNKGVDGNRHWNPDGSYRKHYPGLMKPDIHPQKLCVPCCFNYKQELKDNEYVASKFISEEQEKRRLLCDVKYPNNLTNNKKTNINIELDTKDKKKYNANYVMNEQKNRLPENRLSYLPKSIQNFMYTDNTLCYDKPSTYYNIKENHPCILRYGVENNLKQSFLSCIVKALELKNVTKIKDLKNYIVTNITLDDFVSYQNGDLINLFFKEYDEDIDWYVYEKSKLYKNISKSDSGINKVFLKICNAFDNFKKYILSDEEINYKYLWDMISKPNKYLFKTGVNLVILKILNDDITNNIEFICPTNQYSSVKYNKNKPYLIIIEENGYYELVCKYIDYGKKKNVSTTFLFKYDEKYFKEFNEVIKLINLSNKKCNPIKVFKTYEFKNNIPLYKLKEELETNNLKIKKQIINNFGKVIGIILEKYNLYIPCYPSNIDLNYNYEQYQLMTEEYKLGYQETKDLLEYINDISNKKILTKPKIKIFENDLIVGILTETNQLVPVIPSPDFYKDDLDNIEGNNFLFTDLELLFKKKKNKEMETFTKKIKLETSFFNIFRNNIRLQLIKYKNIKNKKKIENIIKDNTISYLNKIKSIKEILYKIIDEKIKFISYSDEMIDKILEIDIDICSKQKNNCNEISFCYTSDDGCNIYISKYNLFNNNDNEILYITRIADELVRYSHIRTFLLDPNIYTSFSNIKYNLNKNEIILLETLLLKYFVDNKIENTNSFIMNNTYDTINPINSSNYIPYLEINQGNINVVDSNDVINKEKININEIIPNICFNYDKGNINISAPPSWKEKYGFNNDKNMKLFKNLNSINIIGGKNNISDENIELFNNRINCAFYLIQLIIRNHSKKEITIEEIKNIIINGYNELKFDKFYNIIYNKEKRRKFFNVLFKNIKNIKKKYKTAKINNNVTNFEEEFYEDFFVKEYNKLLLESPDFYLHIIDIVIVCQTLNIPLIIATKDNIVLETLNNEELTVTTNKLSNYYYILLVSVITQSNTQPTYNLLINNDNIKFNFDELPYELQNKIRESNSKYKNYKDFNINISLDDDNE